jgi:1,4-dihydroxy-2-naphthoate octaprenyltransferase
MERNKYLSLSASLVMGAIGLILFLQLFDKIGIGMYIFGALSTFYILPTKKNIGLRWIPGLKIFIITTAWTLLSTSSLSIADVDQCIKHYIPNWLFIFAITIPFDIRDIKTDEKQMQTIPQLIGTSNAIKLSQLCLTSAILLHLLMHFSYAVLMADITFLGIGLFCLQKVKHNASPNYINLYIEGLPIIWLLLSYSTTLF